MTMSASVLNDKQKESIISLSPTYRYLTQSQVGDDIIEKCAKLFSSHYGVWSSSGLSPGTRVKLSKIKLQEIFLFNENTFIVVAQVEKDEVIGHAIGRRFYFHDLEGYVSWITQLVVHSDYRDKGVGTTICQLAWNPKINIACGLVTSNPYTIRSLEHATNCEVEIDKTLLYGKKLIQTSEIPYLINTVDSFNESSCVVNTNFFVSHEEINQIIQRTPNWKLGSIKEGEEYCVVCFSLKKHKRIDSNKT